MEAFSEAVTKGGPVLWLLAVLSLGSLTLIIAKAMQMAGVLSGEGRRAAAFGSWARGERDAAMAALSQGKAPADRLVLFAMRGLIAGRPRAVLDAELTWRGNVEAARLNARIRTLELIAMVSPLLGLLGTVLGMIRSFRDLAGAEGAANASLLAGGIWEALLTTAAGLVVAIPAAIAAGLLADRAERAVQAMEVAVGELYSVEDGVRAD